MTVDSEKIFLSRIRDKLREFLYTKRLSSLRYHKKQKSVIDIETVSAFALKRNECDSDAESKQGNGMSFKSYVMIRF